MEHAEVIVAGVQERRRQEERRAASGEDACRDDALPARAVEHEIGSGDRKPDEHPAVEVGPEHDQRHEQPHEPTWPPGLGAQKKQRRAEQHEREELRAHDEERRDSGEEDEHEHHRARGVGRAESTHTESEQRQCRGHSDELRDQEASIPAHDLQRVEDELAQDRHVDPVDRRRRGIGNARRDRAPLENRPAERSEPPGVSPDAPEERAGARA